MLKSKFPLPRYSRNDTGLVTKRLDTKTASPCQQTPNYANRRLTNDIDTKKTKKHLNVCCLILTAILDRVISLKRAFSLSSKEVALKIVVLFIGNMKQNIQPIAVQENAST